MESTDHDYLQFSKNPKLLELVGKGPILFSDKIKKINGTGFSQDRQIVITTDKIYNVHKGQIKRDFFVKELGGISQNLDNKKKEFTLHLPETYDYRFVSDRRETIIKVLQTTFSELVKKNLPIYDIPEKTLKGFTTTEKDKKRNVDRYPPPNFRNFSTDILKEDATTTQVQNKEATPAFNENTYHQDKFKVKNDTSHNAEEEDPDGQDEVQQSIAVGSTTVFKKKNREDAVLEDFQLIRIVGKGTFGKVFQVQHVRTKKIYAMKCIRKDVVIENDSLASLKLEKEILYNIEHPFIVSMDYVFQNQFRIFFLMDFIEGGELFRHLVKIRRFPEEQGCMMIAQIAIALGHLHKQNIVYRDLKPENVLFNRDGYLLLADFGLATKVEKGKLATSFCGTAEYLAPEMLKGQGHDFTVDIWTLGILLYEMLVGIPPFFHKNKHQMFFLIQEANVTFPDPEKHNIYVSPKAQDLINKLLAKKKEKRLGAENGIDAILSHPFFADLDIDLLMKKQLKPKYMPDINEGELKYFDQRLVKDNSVEFSVIPVAGQNQIKKNPNDFSGF